MCIRLLNVSIIIIELNYNNGRSGTGGCLMFRVRRLGLDIEVREI